MLIPKMYLTQLIIDQIEFMFQLSYRLTAQHQSELIEALMRFILAIPGTVKDKV